MVLTMTADRYMNFSSDPAMDRQIYDLTAENIRFLSTLSTATGIDCELDTYGALQVLESDADLRARRRTCARPVISECRSSSGIRRASRAPSARASTGEDSSIRTADTFIP